MGKARRKDKADVGVAPGSAAGLGGGPNPGGGLAGMAGLGAGGGGSAFSQVTAGSAYDADHKLYLEETVLERKVPEADLRQLTDLPPGLDLNEWLASHTIAFFEHVNLLYGAVSEFCTPTTCPDMSGPCQRQYTWIDDRGKKIRLSAPQYIDYVMTYAQRTVSDETIFPTKFAHDFPPTFEQTLRKIQRLLFHVVAHLYHQHFRELLLLGLHGHLHCLFAHLILFNGRFRLIDDKETEILRDLVIALRLQPSDATSTPTTATTASTTPVSRSSQPSPTLGAAGSAPPTAVSALDASSSSLAAAVGSAESSESAAATHLSSQENGLVPSDTRETADVTVTCAAAAAPSGPECDASDAGDALPDDGMVDVSAAQ